MKRVGFVGIGTMGLHMSRNLMKAGYELSIFNRTAEKMQPLVEEGAMPCASPAEVGQQSELVFTCVSDVPDVEEVTLGERGVARGIAPGGIIVDCSTSSPALARRMAEELKPRGIGVLDAPVSGGPEGARTGELSIMVGGEEEVFLRAKPVLEAIGKTILLIGPPGSGQLTKAINQIVGALHLEAVAEGIVLAKKAGIDPEKVIQALGGGAAQSWLLKMRGPQMLRGDFTPARFALGLHAKDLRLAMEAARQYGAKLELAEKVNEIFQALDQEGLGALDHSIMYLHAKRLNQLNS
ncbi:MAG: NAD(P)-dependent oxidoreductase [Candidatus Omnitrophica bacterium]|nr:NAD(P)-dependent oxidoreductase [Candidatus Omnitrophota bacterium]HPP00644.1 NAD(P)-dependent oxidoreductase [bacterium]HXK93205.1 NAD(P)-dependent oxidoreductase [bacterium]